MKPQELSNEELIEHCKYSVKYNVITSDVPYFNQLITRFERITLGQVADDAAKKAEELMQPTLQVGWEYKNGKGEWVQIVKFEKVSKDDEYPYSCSKDNCYASNGLRYAKRGETEHSLILSTGRPMKKVQVDDEVEALAEKIYVSSHTATPKQSFEIAQEFINHRNERRGKNGK